MPALGRGLACRAGAGVDAGAGVRGWHSEGGSQGGGWTGIAGGGRGVYYVCQKVVHKKTLDKYRIIVYDHG